MHPIVTLLIIGAVALMGYTVPKKCNAYFERAYRVNAVSMPMAIATAVSAALWLIFMDLDGFWYWLLLIVSILLCIVSVAHVFSICLQVRTSGLEIAFAVFAQILAIAGIIIQIIGLIAFFMEIIGKKKKRK